MNSFPPVIKPDKLALIRTGNRNEPKAKQSEMDRKSVGANTSDTINIGFGKDFNHLETACIQNGIIQK